MIDVFVVHDDPERAAAIRSAIKSNPDMTLASETQTGREGMFAAATILTGHPRMLVVRLNLGDMTGFDFINQVRQKAPDIYIIPALEGTEGGQVWQNLLQLELRDVLVGPLPPAEITKVLNTAAPRAQQKFDQNKAPTGIQGESFVMSVISARGGVGKSVIATNLASAIAKLSDSTTLLDFSLSPGDFAVMLDDVPRNNIMDAVQQGGALDAEYLNNTLAPHPRLRFRYLASPNQEFDPSGFDYNVALAIMQATRTLSQYVVVDTGLSMAGATVAAVDASDVIFLVTSRDVARLLSAKNLIKFLKSDRQVTNQKLKVLVNEAEIGAEISEGEIESLLEHPVAAYLPCNAGPVTFSINSGAPIVTAEPHHPISVVLNKLAELSFYRWQEKPSEDVKNTKKSLLGAENVTESGRPLIRRMTCSDIEVEEHTMAIPPPAFNRPVAPVPGAIPRPGAIPSRGGNGAPPRPGGAGIPPRPTPTPASLPATSALPAINAPTSALHSNNGNNGSHSQQRQTAQPDAAQEFVMQFKKQLLPYLVQQLDPKLLERGNEAALKHRIEELVDERLTADKVPIGRQLRVKLLGDIIDEMVGFGPLEQLLKDDTITEIMVNGHSTIYTESKGKLLLSPIKFLDVESCRRVIDKILSPLGRRVDESSPLCDARLPDGSRVNVIIPPLALNGPVITIRKFSKSPLTMEKLIGYKALSQSMAMLLKACVHCTLNIVISGGTGSGKTTMLNALSSYIPDGERIVTIEDAAELNLQQEHVVRLESKPKNIEGKGEISIRDLVKNSLRMRPDRIVIGECRGGEALDMIQAMNTGHDGSLTTTHANSPRDAVARLETLVMMAGMDLPQLAIRQQIAGAVHMIVQISRLADGSRKCVYITEVQGMEGNMVTLQDVFKYEQTGVNSEGKLIGITRGTGIVPKCQVKFNANELNVPVEIYQSVLHHNNPEYP